MFLFYEFCLKPILAAVHWVGATDRP